MRLDDAVALSHEVAVDIERHSPGCQDEPIPGRGRSVGVAGGSGEPGGVEAPAQDPSGTSAIARPGPPEEPAILTGKKTNRAPRTGNSDSLVKSST